MDWEYIHTLTKFSFSDNELIFLNENVDSYLMSLITGLSQRSFGINTITKTRENIKNLRERIGLDKKFFIDSGGYSIIVGDIDPRDIMKCIECYHYYLENYASTDCDYMFSLDIPILLKYPEYNTVQYIQEKNYISGNLSKQILEKNKQLYDKFVFVWQFKTKNQYKIWSKYYDDIYQNSDVYHYGIGGQVGLRGATGIDFSPFIGLSYKLLSFIKNKNLNKTSILHMLGVYSFQDRFLIAFFQKLFNDVYLKDNLCKIKITYDTVHHTVQGFYRGQTIKPLIIENDDVHYDFIVNIEDKLELITKNQELLKQILHDVNNIKNNNRLSDPYVFGLLEVIKHCNIDKILDKIISEYDFVDLFLNCSNYNKFKNLANKIFQHLEKKYPFAFKNRTSSNLLNFQIIYQFHNWFMNTTNDYILFDKLMYQFIKLINFPVDLKE